MKRKLTGILLAFTLALILAAPVYAGGWAIINLDELPGQVPAGQPIEIGFTVLQHGITPLSGLTPSIGAHLKDTNETMHFTAREEGAAGHYAATLNFPKAGEWAWTIEAFIEQPMPPLTVVSTSPQAADESPTTTVFPIPSLLTGFLGLGGVMAGVFILKRKNALALALVAIGLIVAGVGFASAAGQAGVKVEAPVSALNSKDQAEVGRDLFIAKGCITCHYHADVIEYRAMGVDAGPNLTDFSAAPEYLRMRLNDPKSVKSDAKMPKLNLSEEEIEALIAFINSD